MTPATTDRELTGRSVLIVLFAFFGIVFAVNAYSATAAIQTYTGVVAQEPYRKGLTYNRRVAASERQSALGWTASLEADRDGHAHLDVVDANGHPVANLAVTGTLGRPSTDIADRSLTFIETTPGTYENHGASIDSGTWIATIAARTESTAAEPVFQLRRRLWLKP